MDYQRTNLPATPQGGDGAAAQPAAPQPPVDQYPPYPTPPTPESVAQATQEELENQRRTAFEESQMFPGQFKPIPEEDILIWESPSRPFKKRNRQFYTTIAMIVVLISMILFFAGQFLPIAVVISVAFLAYVMSSVPPHNAKHKITTYGIKTEGILYYWEEMGRFWFEDKYDQKMLKVEVARFPGRLTLMLGQLKQEDIEDILKEVLLKEKPKDTFFDKSAKWLQEKIPLDTD